MRKFLILGAGLLAACSDIPQNQGYTGEATPDVRQEASAPGIDVTSAPGVAFNYRYAFRLPNNRIAQVQEAHANACEKLGLQRCRITGMRYRLVNQTDIHAMLALRLDPRLARQFGRAATDTVAKADGMLVDQMITGEDVGSRLSGASRSEAELREQLRGVEAELARAAPAAPVRQSLLDRAQELRRQIGNLSPAQVVDREALAGTPMVFNYGSGSVVPGFDVRSPFRSALQQSVDNVVRGLATILLIAISLLPWALLLALGIWAYRALRRRYGWYAPGYRSDGMESEPAPTRPRSRRRKVAATTEA